MPDYINREGLINNRPEGRNPKQISKEEYNKGWNDCRSAFYTLIKDMPAADVAPVRHGKWEWDTDDIYMCSNCAEKSHVKEVMGRPAWGYCPNCGCRMDGGIE